MKYKNKMMYLFILIIKLNKNQRSCVNWYNFKINL